MRTSLTPGSSRLLCGSCLPARRNGRQAGVCRLRIYILTDWTVNEKKANHHSNEKNERAHSMLGRRARNEVSGRSAMTASTTIAVEDSAGVRIITLNRPDKLNSFNEEMHGALREALAGASEDGVRA